MRSVIANPPCGAGTTATTLAIEAIAKAYQRGPNATKMPDAGLESTRKLSHVLNQIRWVTRISVALSASVRVEDVYSVLLSGLLSPLGLGYSHAIVFEVEPANDRIIGKFALGYESREQMDELKSELEQETAFLDKRRKQLATLSQTDEAAFEELRTLELGTHWVTVFQRLGEENPETLDVKRLNYVFRKTPEGTETPPLFQLAIYARTPHLVKRAQELVVLPQELSSHLPEEFALLPLRTNKGLRAVILLDRRLSKTPISVTDLETLDWFATQGALALQNAELIKDLENAYQELKTVDQLKSNFLSIISHELRTPLTAITGFVELILNKKVGEVNESQQNLLMRVAKNTGHLNNMVNDLIEIAEIEAEGIHDVNMEPVDPLATVFSTMPKLEYRRRDTRVTIEPVFEGVVPKIVCDQRALERIYFHLLDNAVKFSPKDECVIVEFRVTPRGDQLKIAIRDKGLGIPKDKLARIFEQFFQVDNSLTRSHEGLGLGLAVTRMLVQATRGEIDVESTLGKGSSFVLTYPIAK